MNPEDTQPDLSGSTEGLNPIEPQVGTQDSEPVTTPAESRPRKAGSGKTAIYWISPDFDEPLEEFREYME